MRACNYADAMQNTQWWTYVERLIAGETYTEAARRAGFDKSAFTRWKNGAKADPEFVVVLARAYGANVLEALVEAGFITEEEAQLREVQADGVTLHEATNLQLAEEGVRRVKAGNASKTVEAPLDNVHPLTARNQPSGVDVEPDWSKMAARKTKSPKGQPDYNPNE